MRASFLIMLVGLLSVGPMACNTAKKEANGRHAGTLEAAKGSPVGEKEVAMAPPPAAAKDAPAVQRAGRDQGPKSGLLTAGSFDDNLAPAFFQRFAAERGQLPGLADLSAKLAGQRLQITVRDKTSRPVGNSRVHLSAKGVQGVEVATRSDGRAVFLLPFDQLPAGQALIARVTPPPAGGATGGPVAVMIAAGESHREITLADSFAQAPACLDLAIVLDTTGSMGDELNHLKAEIRGISAAVHKQFPGVRQRFALVLYRDQGDEYVVRSFDFTPSLDQFHNNLSAQRADGGGDYPEAMHEGLQAAGQLSWQQDAVKVLFLIADAPPHAEHMKRTLAAANGLRKQGVAMYPVACSGYDDSCELVMRSCALLTGSQFLFLTDDSGVGDSHAEPKVPYYSVERLERLMIRMIASELSGRRLEANPADVLRTVGKKQLAISN